MRLNRRQRRASKKNSGRPLWRPRLERLEDRLAPATFTVVNTADSGAGSLRQAMLDANATPNVAAGVPDEIHFNIAGAGLHTIKPTSALPPIGEAVTINGYTQPGASPNTHAMTDPDPSDNAVFQIEISGASIGFGGLFHLNGTGGSTVKGLVINRVATTPFNIGQYLSDRSNDNTIAGNFIGTDATGMAYLRGREVFDVNGAITVINGTGNKIGGTAPADRNVIVGGGTLIDLSDGGQIVQGNYLGINAAGTAVLQPSDSSRITTGIGTGRYDSPVGGNLIGGTEPGAGNVIVSTRSDDPDVGSGAGIEIGDSGNLIFGNFIGTNAAGTAGLDGGIGIDASAGENNTIAGNLISGDEIGIMRFSFDSTPSPAIRGNKIGTDITGTAAIPNLGSGILIGAAGSASAGGVIGGPNPGDGNTIAFNGGDGVTITDGFAAWTILGNSIFSNSGLGIANGRHTYPVLTSVTSSGGTTTIQGTLDTGGSTYRVEFFSNDAADPSGFGEGQTFLGFADIATDSSHTFTTTLPVAVASRQFITATATDPIGNTSEFSAGVQPTVLARRPVLIVPGIGGTYTKDLDHEHHWLVNRGLPPDQLAIDPIAGTYDALIESLKNAGYVEGQDLFVATYDWRLPPGPDDGIIDGHISRLTASVSPSDSSLTSITDNRFDYGVDYLGYWLRQAAESWASRFGAATPLDSVDVIVHSTGGLVTRSYMESDAYGGSFFSSNLGTSLPLPKINNFIMVAVPNRGSTLPWNPLHNNFIGDFFHNFTGAFNMQLVFSSLVDRAYQEVVHGGTIAGPTPITLQSILDAHGQPSQERFIEEYIPTLRSLLATFDFLKTPGGLLTNVNQQSDIRNNVLLDLNNGLDLTHSIGDGDFSANDFAALAKVSAIFGTNLATPARANQFEGETSAQALTNPFGEIVSFDTFYGRHPGATETWYQDATQDADGDNTVRIESSAGQFVGDDRIALHGFAQPDFANPLNPADDVSHGGLMSNPNVEQLILQILGQSLPDDRLGTKGGLNNNDLGAAMGFPVTTLEKLNFDAVLQLSGLTLTASSDVNNNGFDFSGSASVFGSGLMAVNGHLSLANSHLVGALRIGGGVPQTLDIPGFHVTGNFVVEINTSFDAVTLDPGQLPPELQEYLTIPPHTARLIVDGSWRIGSVAGDGVLVVTPSLGSTSEFQVYAHGSLDLGVFFPFVPHALADTTVSATVSGTLGMVVDNGPKFFGSLLVTLDGDVTNLHHAELASSSNTFNIAFNATSTPQSVAPQGVSVPADLAHLRDTTVIDPGSVRLLMDATLQVGTVSGEGTFLVQAGLDLDPAPGHTAELQVYAGVQLDLGVFFPFVPHPLAESTVSATVSGTLGMLVDDGPRFFGSFLVTREGDLTNLRDAMLVSSSNTFNLAFNATGAPQPVAPAGVNVPADLEQVKDPAMIDPGSIRLLLDGTLQLGTVSGEGTFLVQAGLDLDSPAAGHTFEIQVFAGVDLDLGVFFPFVPHPLAESTVSATVSGTLGMLVDDGPRFFGSFLVTREGDLTNLRDAVLASSSSTFNIAFNATAAPQAVAPQGVTVPADLAQVKDPSTIDPGSVRLLIDGRAQLGAFSADGTFLFQASLDADSTSPGTVPELDVYAHAEVDLGDFARLRGKLPLEASTFSATLLGSVGVHFGHGVFGTLLVDQATSSGGLGGSNTFNVGFNLSDTPQQIAVANLPPDLQPFLHLDAQSVRLFMSRAIQVGGFAVDGTFMVEVATDRLVAFASGEVSLGLFGGFRAKGYLHSDASGFIADLSLTLDPNGVTRDSLFAWDGTVSFVVNTTGGTPTHDDPLTIGFDERDIGPGVFVQVRDAHFTILDFPAEGSFTIGFAPGPDRFVLSIPSDSPLTFPLWRDFPAAIYGTIDTTGDIDLHINALFDVGIHGIFEIGGSYNDDLSNPQPVDPPDGKNGLFQADIGRTDPSADVTFSGEFHAQFKIVGVTFGSADAQINACGFAYFTVDIAGVSTTVYVNFNESFADQDLLDPDTSTTSDGELRTCDNPSPPVLVVNIAPANDSGPSAPTGVVITQSPDGLVKNLAFTVSEGNGGQNADLQLSMPALPAGGSVTISYELQFAPRSPTAADADDVALAASGTLTIDDSATPVILSIPLTGDFVYEGDETFKLVFRITDSSGVSGPQLAITSVTIRIANDDAERPGYAVVYYNFDQLDADNRTYDFTRQAAFAQAPFTAGPFTHSDDTAATTIITTAPGVFKIYPEAPTANPSRAAVATDWTSDGQKYFQFQVGFHNNPLNPLPPFAVVMDLAGIDFWDKASADGPQQWELYSSLDHFEKPIVSGTTHVGSFGHNVPDEFECIHVHVGDFPLTLRLVGLGGAGGAWTVDNVALLRNPFPCNDPPVANSDLGRVTTGQAIRIAVLGNDTDPNRDFVTLGGFTQPAHGSVAANSDGTLTYTPAAGFVGPDRFIYWATDGQLDSVPAPVVIQVLDDPPVALGQTVFTNEDTPLRITLSATDSETLADRFRYRITKSPGHGTLAFGSISASGQAVTYTPYVNFNGSDSFQFTVTDLRGSVSQAATVDLTVRPVNDPPTVHNPTFYRNIGSTISGSVLTSNYARDVDGDTLTISVTAQPLYGRLAWNADGTFTYTPSARDRDDAFSYDVLDGHRGSTRGTASIKVNAPVAGDQSVTTSENTRLSVSLSQSVQPTGVSYNYTIASLPSSSQGTLLDSNRQPVVPGIALPSSVVTFQPAQNFVGAASFTFQAHFGTLTSSAATVHVNVTSTSVIVSGTPVNLSPVNSYVIGGTVFLDVNGNGVLDSPVEPSAVTGIDGVALLTIPAALDRNGDGLIDASEGRLVATGGTELATGLPLTTPFTAPVGSSVITPLTSLISVLMDRGRTFADAQADLRLRLGLPDYDLTQFDHVAQTAAGNPDGPAIAVRVAEVHDAVAQAGALLAGLPDVPASYSRAVFDALADLLGNPAIDFDFANTTFVAGVIQGAANRLGTVLDPAIVGAAATVIADGNRRIEQIAPSADLNFLTRLEQVQEVALGKVTGDLALLGAGNLIAEVLLADDTGAALDAVIDSTSIDAILPPARPGPTLQGVATTSVDEGGTSTLSGTIVNPADHALALEINWGDGRTQSVNLLPGTTSFAVGHCYLDDDPTSSPADSVLVGVLLLSDATPGDVANSTLTVTNVAPVIASLSGPAGGVRGQNLTYTGSFSDPGADTWTATVNFGDGSGSRPLVLNPDKSFSFDHVFTTTGTYDVVVTIRDDDGGVGARTLSVVVTGTALMADPLDPSHAMLVVGGTTGDDAITISPDAGGKLQVSVNGVSQGSFATAGRIVVYGQAGNDDIQVDGGVPNAAWLFGDGGDDRLKGGAGDDVLLGGDGDDLLVGGNGRDLMIGGRGADRLVGNAGDDILIAGWTAFDANQVALHGVQVEWTSARDYATRVANIKGIGSGPRNNGTNFLTVDGPSATAFDDGAEDILTGSAGEDWFLANLDAGVKDKLTDLSAKEFASDLDFIGP